MQINVRKGSGTLPQKNAEKPKKKGKEALKKSGASSQESREERRAKRLQDLQRSRENIAQQEQEQELSLNPPEESDATPVVAEGDNSDVSTVSVSTSVAEGELSDGAPTVEEVEEQEPSFEAEGVPADGVFETEWPKADRSAEAATEAEALAAFELAADMDAPSVKSETADRTPTVPKGHAGLSLGPAKSKRNKAEPTGDTEQAILEDVPQKKSKGKQPKSKPSQAGRKSGVATNKKKSQKKGKSATPAEFDSLDLAYSEARAKGGNSLSIVFILGMILATAVSAGAGFIFSDVIQTLFIPLGV